MVGFGLLGGSGSLSTTGGGSDGGGVLTFFGITSKMANAESDSSKLLLTSSFTRYFPGLSSSVLTLKERPSARCLPGPVQDSLSRLFGAERVLLSKTADSPCVTSRWSGYIVATSLDALGLSDGGGLTGCLRRPPESSVASDVGGGPTSLGSFRLTGGSAGLLTSGRPSGRGVVLVFLGFTTKVAVA